ncbi:hypothetical protein [Neobacillus massiliamazoniensis]|uniref:Helix-turn-helix domain-containing protein n=1 Tax=Neobacillus massiliamazoniensis TaxID=1499688 RepID=A0A0U1NRG5_9BACI|nr:hypothetical protein [Neobacillus massiliamazoniensis]CRK80332.1 hypothetical protein BN000_00213 [Neobacillus massiliamazoniensis]
MGQKHEKFIFILPNAKLDYTPKEIETFVSMWNDGQPISAIAEKLYIQKYEVGLLVMHCNLEGFIQHRYGGLRGTKPHKWINRHKGVVK